MKVKVDLFVKEVRYHQKTVEMDKEEFNDLLRRHQESPWDDALAEEVGDWMSSETMVDGGWIDAIVERSDA